MHQIAGFGIYNFKKYSGGNTPGPPTREAFPHPPQPSILWPETENGTVYSAVI